MEHSRDHHRSHDEQYHYGHHSEAMPHIHYKEMKMNSSGHDGMEHTKHDKHAGHHIEDFSKRFASALGLLLLSFFFLKGFSIGKEYCKILPQLF